MLDEQGNPKKSQVVLSEGLSGQDSSKPEVLEEVLYQAAITPNVSKVSRDRTKPWEEPEIQVLLRQRRDCTTPVERKVISKQIQKVSRKLVRKYKDEKVERVLKEFADLGRLDNISKDTKPKKETSATIESVEFVKLFENVYMKVTMQN